MILERDVAVDVVEGKCADAVDGSAGTWWAVAVTPPPPVALPPASITSFHRISFSSRLSLGPCC